VDAAETETSMKRALFLVGAAAAVYVFVAWGAAAYRWDP
jgi:hypothetical protein